MRSSTLLPAFAGLSLTLANLAPNDAIIAPIARAATSTAAWKPPPGSVVVSHVDPACVEKYKSLIHAYPTAPSAVAEWGSSAYETITTLAAPTAVPAQLTTLCHLRWDPASTLTPPPALASASSSWRVEQESWRDSIAPEARSIATSCGGDFSVMLETILATDLGSCTRGVDKVVANGMIVGLTVTTTARTATAAATAATGATSSAVRSLESAASSGAGAAGESGGSGSGSGSPTAASSSSSTGGAIGPRETGYVAAVAVAAVAAAGVMAAL